VASKQSFEFEHVVALLQFVDPEHVTALTQFLEFVHVTAFGQFSQLVQLLALILHWQLYSVHKHITITAIINQFFVKAHVLNAIVFCIIVIYLAVYFGRLLNSALRSFIKLISLSFYTIITITCCSFCVLPNNSVRHGNKTMIHLIWILISFPKYMT
jgi:hypothetical protein